MDTGSKTGGDAPGEASGIATNNAAAKADPAPRRGRKSAQGGGARKPADTLDAFRVAVTVDLAERLGDSTLAEQAAHDPNLDVTVRTHYGIRSAVSNAPKRCADAIVDMLAAARAEQVYRAKLPGVSASGGN